MNLKIEYQLDIITIESLLQNNDILIPGNNSLTLSIESPDNLPPFTPLLEFNLNVKLSQFTLDRTTVVYTNEENKEIPLFNYHK